MTYSDWSDILVIHYDEDDVNDGGDDSSSVCKPFAVNQNTALRLLTNTYLMRLYTSRATISTVPNLSIPSRPPVLRWKTNRPLLFLTNKSHITVISFFSPLIRHWTPPPYCCPPKWRPARTHRFLPHMSPSLSLSHNQPPLQASV